MSYEAWLMLVAAALYLQDGVQALRPDEAVLERSLTGRWAARFGARQWKLGGREIWLPNPFAPHRASFRLAWRMEGAALSAPGAAVRPLAAPPELGRLASFVWVSWLALFALLPLGLFVAGSVVTFSAVALLYANNLTALTLAYRWRGRLGIASAGRFFPMAFECLACAPYSVNLIRRLCALMATGEDFTQAAARLLQPDQLSQVNEQCLARIDEQIEAEPEDSARMQALKASRIRLLKEEPAA